MAVRAESAMWDRLLNLSGDSALSLQSQIRERLVAAILDGHLPPGLPLPSTRELADHLRVSRNTVVIAYGHLVDEGLIEARERRGYFVREDAVGEVPDADGDGGAAGAGPRAAGSGGAIRWAGRFRYQLGAQRNIVKPADWQDYPYPFIYGQFDPDLFPIADWRECCRQALGVMAVRDWAVDAIDGDDRMFIEQLRTRVLPRRGVWATTDEIMVTIGAQQALYLLCDLLFAADTVVGVEEPGYPDARNIFSLRAGALVGLGVDGKGLKPDTRLDGCDYVYATPSHQCPTTVTMPLDRRRRLLERAREADFVVIEDDHEIETRYTAGPTPSLKSLDRDGRVIYVGNLSKSFAPGLRLGYIVASRELIAEARRLRRLMLRHPPSNNLRAAALFLSLGHHDAHLRRLVHVFKERSEALARALARHLRGCRVSAHEGGSSYWVEGPPTLDASRLAERAREAGILIEPGEVFFMSAPAPRNYFRLGFASIDVARIDPGIERLAALMRDM